MANRISAMPQVKVLRNVEIASLSQLVLKPTALNGTDPSDAVDNLVTLDASKIDLGFWACSPGAFKTARAGVNEVILVLEGSGTLVSDEGERVDHTVGDVVIIPDGWSGSWEIHENFKKHYITVTV